MDVNRSFLLSSARNSNGTYLDLMFSAFVVSEENPDYTSDDDIREVLDEMDV